MTRRLEVAALAAALAALPLAALAAGDKPADKAAGSYTAPAPSASTTSAPAAGAATTTAPAAAADSSAEGMFKSLDKNNDGFISREEARGSPHEKDFAKLDKDGDGKLSPAEHAAAPEHAGSGASTAAKGMKEKTVK